MNKIVLAIVLLAAVAAAADCYHHDHDHYDIKATIKKYQKPFTAYGLNKDDKKKIEYKPIIYYDHMKEKKYNSKPFSASFGYANKDVKAYEKPATTPYGYEKYDKKYYEKPKEAYDHQYKKELITYDHIPKYDYAWTVLNKEDDYHYKSHQYGKASVDKKNEYGQQETRKENDTKGDWWVKLPGKSYIKMDYAVKSHPVVTYKKY